MPERMSDLGLSSSHGRENLHHRCTHRPEQIVHLAVLRPRGLDLHPQPQWRHPPLPRQEGALAGRNFYLSHDVDFSTGPQGETIAVYRSSSAKAMVGGAIGVHKSSSAHNEYANKLAQALQYQGILLGVQ